jgi:hypothetical protein
MPYRPKAKSAKPTSRRASCVCLSCLKVICARFPGKVSSSRKTKSPPTGSFGKRAFVKLRIYRLQLSICSHVGPASQIGYRWDNNKSLFARDSLLFSHYRVRLALSRLYMYKSRNPPIRCNGSGINVARCRRGLETWVPKGRREIGDIQCLCECGPGAQNIRISFARCHKVISSRSLSSCDITPLRTSAVPMELAPPPKERFLGFRLRSVASIDHLPSEDRRTRVRQCSPPADVRSWQ